MKSFFRKSMLRAVLLVPLLVGGLSLSTALAAHAQTTNPPATTGCSDITGGASAGATCAAPTKATGQLFGKQGIFNIVTDILLFIIGAISVIMLIIGGIRYVVSGGDQGAVTSAKNTILYAIIGIVVAFLAYGAVTFVTGQLDRTTSSPNTPAGNGNGNTPAPTGP